MPSYEMYDNTNRGNVHVTVSFVDTSIQEKAADIRALSFLPKAG